MGRLADPGGAGVGGMPPAVGALHVRGGVAGTRATLESIATAAVRAGRAARSLEVASSCVRRAAAHPWPPAAHDAGHAAAAALAQVDRGEAGLAACADRASALALALGTAVRTYEDADRAARARVEAIPIVGGAWVGELGPKGWALLALVGGQLTVSVSTSVLGLRAVRCSFGSAGVLARLVPDLSGLRGVAGWLGGAVTSGDGLLPDGLGLPEGDTLEPVVLSVASFWLGSMPGRWRPNARPVEELAARLTLAGHVAARFLGHPERQLVVAPLVGGAGGGSGGGAGGGSGGRRSGEERAPQGVGDVVAQVAALGDEPQPTIAVQRLDHADGSRSWVVSVPGTRSMDLFGGENPMDNTTNLALMAGLPDDMTEAVEVAMLRAGIGPDEPVLLAGHSQGGMVVTRLAASLQGTFDIEAVVTAGSPVSSMPVPDGVAALHLEHAQDSVPALEGRPNPDAVNRTTVVRDLHLPPDTFAGAKMALGPDDLLPAHEAWRYAETAALVDGLDDPSVRGFREALGGVLGDGSARTTTQEYAVARLPVPEPDPARLKTVASPGPPAT